MYVQSIHKDQTKILVCSHCSDTIVLLGTEAGQTCGPECAGILTKDSDGEVVCNICLRCFYPQIEGGKKYDSDKARWDLLPFKEVGEIVDILTFGASKYGANNWQKVEPKSRYFAAAMRHLTAWFLGEKLDKESGLSHLAHAGCCILFLMYKDNNNNE